MNKNNLKDIKQIEKNKVIVDDYLLSLLQEKSWTKEELKEVLRTSERQVRREIQRIAMFYPVISYSTFAGYRVVNTPEVVKRNDPEEISKELEEINHTLNEINSRIAMLKKKQRALIAAEKVLEKCQKL